VSTISHRPAVQCAIVADVRTLRLFARSAAKCGWHANQLTDAETQERLRKLAAEYLERAAKIERKD
jgi:hypothetical protein